MLSVIRKFLILLRDAGYEFIDDNAPKLSASLAYYTIFAVGPLLLVIFRLCTSENVPMPPILWLV